MVEKVEGWKTFEGNLYPTEEEAVEAETRDRLWAHFKNSGCNEGQANALSKNIMGLAGIMSPYILLAQRKVKKQGD